MADDQQASTGGQASQQGGTTPPVAGKVTISDEINQKYGDLVKLILGSESMNDEERQYWINILPIMTPEQLQNLRDILENEKKQLKAIDDKYSKEIEQVGQTQLVKQMEDERRKKRTDRQEKEATHNEKEQQETDDIMKQIQGQ